MILALIRTFMVIIIGTFSGYLCQKVIDKKNWMDSESKKKVSVFLQKLGMLWLISITYIGSLWIFEIESLTEIFSLPFVGAVSTVVGGYFAVIIAKYNKYNRIDIGSMFSCGYFANTVTLGGMICFFYLGEEGYALVPIFTFFMRLQYYALGYPIAHMYADSTIIQKESLARLIEVIKDPFFYVGVGSVLIGLFLNLSTLQRPQIYASINEVLIPLTTFILLFSVGLTFKLSRVSRYIKECLLISLVKFFIVPATILIIGLLFGYQHISDGLPLKVSIILSAMPVAFNSVIAANIYNLNIDLVNSCWIFTTFAVLLVLPIILFVVGLF
jgi:predicted permease